MIYFLIFSLLSFSLIQLGRSIKFFKPWETTKSALIVTKSQCGGAFFLFLFLQIIFIPITALVVFPVLDQTTIDLYAILLSFILGGFLIFLLSVDQRKALFGEHFFVKNVLWGASLWVMSYPAVVAVVSLASSILSFLAPEAKEVDQVAVKHLLFSLDHKFKFISLVFGIVFMVPFIEELLFRGFLQNYLKTICRRELAIIWTSLFFAGFHFSLSQGLSNVPLLLALFTLSCFLGAAFEQRRSLLASYGLHATFNMMSILFILAGLK